MLPKKLILIIAIIATFVNILSVKAESLTFDEVVNKMKNSELYKSLNTNEVSTEITSTSDKMVITYDADESGTWITEFSFANSVISYKFSGNKNDETTFSQAFIDGLWLSEVIKIVANANGYTDEQIKSVNEEAAKSFTLEKNGLEITEFEYTYEGSSPGNEVSLSGSGTDTFKININFLDLELTNNITIIPNIEITETTQNSITLKIKANTSENKMCKIYKSTNGNDYDYLMSVNCNLDVTYIDENVNENTTYYYKAIIEGQNEYSKVVNATTTPYNNVNQENTNNEINSSNKNEYNSSDTILFPETGLESDLLISSIFIIPIIILFFYLRKINYFKKL